MEFKGTKGEWEVSKDNPKIILTDKGAYKPNAMMLSTASKEEMQDNAKLIAAAPELLEALQFIIDNGEKKLLSLRTQELINKAINKALK